jgi:hypothetical protein
MIARRFPPQACSSSFMQSHRRCPKHGYEQKANDDVIGNVHSYAPIRQNCYLMGYFRGTTNTL